MKFDYVEIGTSCFKTLAEIYKDDDAVFGLSVEAVPQFLNILKDYCKDSKNKYFLNAAISNDLNDVIDFYYIDPKKVENWIAVGIAGIGCVSVDELKNTIRSVVPEFNLNERQIKKISVASMSFSDVVKKYSISEISFLKIDAEGCDYDILMDWTNTDVKINSVLFEAKPFMSDEQIKTLVDVFESRGYVCDLISDHARNVHCYIPGEGRDTYKFNYQNKNSWIKRIKGSNV